MSWRHPLPSMAPFGRRLLHGAREQELAAARELYPVEQRRVTAEKEAAPGLETPRRLTHGGTREYDTE